jgi:hypothetical protein
MLSGKPESTLYPALFAFKFYTAPHYRPLIKGVKRLEIRRKQLYKKERVLTRENIHLKKIIGALTIELKNRRVARMKAMTKVMVDGFGWMYIMAVLDWYTKKIAGYYTGMECSCRHWLEALDLSLNRSFPMAYDKKTYISCQITTASQYH